jgi:translocation and assembly module TamA
MLAASAAAISAGVCAGPAHADEPKAKVEGVENRALRQAMERLVGETRNPPETRYIARRRANEAAEAAVVVLRSEGYYDYAVVPEVTEDTPPRPIVRVTPGPRFTVRSPKVEWVDAPPSALTQATAQDAISLPQGTPGRAAEVVAAEGRIVAALSENGYADAEARPREVVVDHADRSVRPTFRIHADDLVRLDGMSVRTTGRTDKDWVQRLAPWTVGDRYSPDAVGELERRLLDTGVYDSVTVALAPKTENVGDLRPVVVSLNDRPKATLDAGASYSSGEGFGVDGRYTLYNRLGRADTLSFGAQYSNILKRLDVQLSLPHWRVVQETLRLSAAVYQDDTDAYEENDAGVRADLIKRLGRTSYRTFGIGFDVSDNDEKQLIDGQIVGVNRQLATVTGLAALTLDRSNDPLNPSSGWKLDGRVEPTVSVGDGTATYVRATAQGSAYLPFGEKARTVLAGRLRLGSILGGDIPTVPGPRRFFAGGAGSVRGYEYQGVGPRFPDNTPIGGVSLVEASIEARHNFTDKWGAVVFVDAGSVGDNQYPDFQDLSVGAGVGLRYNLSFAPVRVDIGIPLNRREGDGAFQVYISLGQAF